MITPTRDTLCSPSSALARRGRRGRWPAAWALVVAVLLSACGGGAAQDQADTTADGSVTGAPELATQDDGVEGAGGLDGSVGPGEGQVRPTNPRESSGPSDPMSASTGTPSPGPAPSSARPPAPSPADGASSPSSPSSPSSSSATAPQPGPDAASAPSAPSQADAVEQGGAGVAPGTYRSDFRAESSSPIGSREHVGVVVQTWQAAVVDDRGRTLQAGQVTREGGDDSGPDSGDHSQVVWHDVDAHALRLVEQIADGDDEGALSFRPDEPVLLAPLGADPGASWSWTMVSLNGETTVSLQAKLLRREPVQIDGVTVDAAVIASTLDVSNPEFEATQRLTTWVDEATRLTVREESSLQGRATVGGVPVEFTSRIEETLRTRVPS